MAKAVANTASAGQWPTVASYHRIAPADDRERRPSSCYLHRSSRVPCASYGKKKKTCIRCTYLHYTRTVRVPILVLATRMNTPGHCVRRPYSRWPHWSRAVTNTDHDGPLGISIVIPCAPPPYSPTEGNQFPIPIMIARQRQTQRTSGTQVGFLE